MNTICVHIYIYIYIYIYVYICRFVFVLFAVVPPEEFARLTERAQVLGTDVTKVAAGWVLKTSGSAGIPMALGLLALHDTAGAFADKALQLRFLSTDALTYLISALDMAYLLKHLGPQTPSDIELMRFCASLYTGIMISFWFARWR